MQTPRPALIVSIHDVSPLTRVTVEEMLADLAAIGIGRTSLLVIPDHHHRAMIGEDPAFCAWLREVAGQGHEIVLHGYYHKRPKKKAPDYCKILSRSSIRREKASFSTSPRPKPEVRLEKAREEFSAAGLRPTGFIAPAWLLSADAEEAVRKAGFTYTTRLQNFKDLRTGREDASQSLVWSVRSGWRRAVSCEMECLAGQKTHHQSAFAGRLASSGLESPRDQTSDSGPYCSQHGTSATS